MAGTNVNHVSVVARNLAVSVTFYSELFSAEPLSTPNFGFPVQWLRIGRVQLHVFERGEEAPLYHHFGVTVDDFERVYRLAERLDVHDRHTFGHHLYELPNDIAQLYIRDPAGNLVEVDSPNASLLPADIARVMRRLADDHVQSDENLRATLFLSS